MGNVERKWKRGVALEWAAGGAFHFVFPRCTWFGKKVTHPFFLFFCFPPFLLVWNKSEVEDVCKRFYFSIAMMKIKKKHNKMMWNIPHAVLVISLFSPPHGPLTCFGLCWLDAGLVVASHWHFVYSTPQRTDCLTPPLFFCFFFLELILVCFGSCSSAFRLVGSFCWDVWKSERAQWRASALAPGPITSPSVSNNNQASNWTTSSRSSRQEMVLNKSEVRMLLFCRGAAAVWQRTSCVEMMNLATRLLLNCESFKANLLFISFSTLVN